MTCKGALRAWLLPLVLLFLACAEERPPINQVQANALPKNIFEGSQWYTHQTVIDTPAQSRVAFVGESSPLRKIEWEIQEGYLIARNVLQHIDGIEDNPIAGAGSEPTLVVAMYAIESHFDIRRSYNPSTGEELNVIEENSRDRPWYQRSHFRVNWSKNLVTSEDLTLTSGFAGVTLEPVNYFVQDPAHPFAPRFEETAEGEVYYVDIVNKYFAKPETVRMANGATIPSCYLVFAGNVPCEPAEIAVRNSFLRIDAERDYQPLEYTADRMERFGYFLTYRDAYDPDYGVIAARRLRLVNRHDIWQGSHKRDSAGNLVTCARDADCGGAGSECDVTLARAKRLNRGACTIPYRERTVKPVAYHLSEGFPEDLVPDANDFASDWSRALRDTVGSLRSLECREDGGTDCDAQRERDDARELFVLCRNPVAATDPAVCGEEGTVARIGDLRYNLLAWVSEETQGPLGYGPSFADPETGEIISASAFVYGASLIRLAAQARDLLALINGDLEASDLTDNANFAGWIRDVRSGRTDRPVPREAHLHVAGVDGLDAPAINAGMSFQWMDELLSRDPSTIRKPTIAEAKDRYDSAKARLVKSVGDLRLGDTARARLASLKGTDVEALMIDDELRIAAGVDLDAQLNDDVLDKASPLRGMNLQHFRELDSMQRKLSGRPGSCVLNGDFADEGLLGLVRDINRAVRDGDGTVTWYGVPYIVAREVENGRRIDYAQVEQMIRHPIFNAVMSHEVGHTVGLRHNFSGSFDSLNYKPRYWELRDDGNMQPRAWDPMTTQELDGRIREYQYSSVMDYGNNFIVSDAAGLGYYDVAAIKMGYGDLVEVFTSVPEENKQLVASVVSLQRFGWPGAIDLLSDQENLRSIPYTEMPGLLGGIASLASRDDVRFRSLRADPQLFADELVYDDQGRLAVPYRYCSDEFADYEPNCLRYDAGADEYETLTSITDTYWNYYLLNNFMRQRIGFEPSSVPSTVYSRYFAKLESANLYYSLFRGLLVDLGATGDFFERIDGFGAFTTGIGAAYQLLTRTVATPEPGCHEQSTRSDGAPILVQTSSRCPQGSRALEIDRFDGRSLRTGFSLGPDQSFWFLTRSGYFQDKALALQVLSDPGARVLGQDTNVDIRNFQVSFYTTFQKPIQSLLRGIIGEDVRPYAPRFRDGSIVYPSIQEQLSGDAEGVPVDPNVSFALQLYTMVYGMAYLPRTFDYSFIDRARLFVKGGAESVTLELPEGASLLEFLDEESGLVYVAPSYPDAEGRETGVSAQVLRHAQSLKDSGRAAELRLWMANISILRRLTYLMGFGGDQIDPLL